MAENSADRVDSKLAANVSELITEKAFTKPVFIGAAGNSVCAKSTIMRHVTGIFDTEVSMAYKPVPWSHNCHLQR